MNKKGEASDSLLDFIMKKREIKLKKMEKIILVVLIAVAIPFLHHVLERRE
jgi:cell division protein FtsL